MLLFCWWSASGWESRASIAEVPECKQCTCLGISNLSPITGQLTGKCLFSRGIVKLNECQHSLLVLERASPLFWPNSRNIKDVFRQWERERVWCDWRKLLSKRWCFVQGYYGWKPVPARRGSTVQQAHSQSRKQFIPRIYFVRSQSPPQRAKQWS